MTQDEPTASVFHRQTKQQPIEAQAFVASPKKRRQIMHYFAPPEDKYWSADCVVITPEVGRDIILNQELLASILSNVRRLILCIDLRVVFLNPSLLFWLCRQVLTWQVVVKSDKEINWDGFSMYTLVIEFLPQTQRNKSAKCNQPLNNCDFIKNSDS